MARTRGGKTIRTLRWTGLSVNSGAFGAGSVAVTALAAEKFPDTVMRTRGELVGMIVDTLPIPDGVLVRYGFGLVCVPEGTGATVVWSPLSDANAPWFVYASGFLARRFLTVDAGECDGLPWFRERVDSKAMRKCPPDMELQAVFEQSTIVTAQDIRMVFSGRVLLGR